MWDKIKQFYSNSVSWLVTAIIVTAGYIYYILQTNKKLENEIEALKSDAKIKEAKDEVNEATIQADKSVGDYQSVRDAYLKMHGDGSSDM